MGQGAEGRGTPPFINSIEWGFFPFRRWLKQRGRQEGSAGRPSIGVPRPASVFDLSASARQRETREK